VNQDPLTFTRLALHAVAELVLAAPQHAATGELALQVVPGGFATTAGPHVELVHGALRRDRHVVPVDGRTPRELLTELELPEASLAGVYADLTGADPDLPLRVGTAAANHLVSAWSAGDAALRRLDPGQVPVLWPEHFDVAIALDEVNYGVSPGGFGIAVPNAYVGPWAPPPIDGFWTEPYGAVRILSEAVTADTVLEFFEEGRSRLGR